MKTIGAWIGTSIGAWIGLLVVLVVLVSGIAQAATWQARPGDALQRVIDAAKPGDVIEIERGYYVGNFVIDKPMTLRGLGKPTLSGGLQGDTVRVDAPDVRIEGLIVRDSGDSLKDQNAGIYIRPGAHRAVVRQCDLTYNLFGLWIEKANDVQIEDNVITGKRDYSSPQRGNGVQLYNTRGAKIVGNRISFVRDALYVDVSHHAVFRGNRLHHSRYGTHYMNSYYNLWEDNESYYNRGGLALMEVRDQIVRNNRAWGNSDHGIMLRTVQDAVVEDNVVAGNNRGFFIYDVEYATLRRNLVVDNDVGVHLSAGSTRNVVQGNDFMLNREQVRYVGARDEAWGAASRTSSNASSNKSADSASRNAGGNHWSNYLGWDRDGDGVGDLPFEANDMVARLSWRHPGVRLLMASPAVQALRMVSQQFPVLRVPSVVDAAPRMFPGHPDWSAWRDKHYRDQ